MVTHGECTRITAVIKSYRLYLEQVEQQGSEPVLDFTRAWTLVRFFDSDMLQLSTCTRCTGLFVAPCARSTEQLRVRAVPAALACRQDAQDAAWWRRARQACCDQGSATRDIAVAVAGRRDERGPSLSGRQSSCGRIRTQLKIQRERVVLVIVGYLVVLGSVFGGYALMGGHFGALFQPLELLMIGGARSGAFIAGNDGKTITRHDQGVAETVSQFGKTRQGALHGAACLAVRAAGQRPQRRHAGAGVGH